MPFDEFKDVRSHIPEEENFDPHWINRYVLWGFEVLMVSITIVAIYRLAISRF